MKPSHNLDSVSSGRVMDSDKQVLAESDESEGSTAAVKKNKKCGENTERSFLVTLTSPRWQIAAPKHRGEQGELRRAPFSGRNTKFELGFLVFIVTDELQEHVHEEL